MRRRDVPKMLLGAAALGADPAGAAQPDIAALEQGLRTAGLMRIPDGAYQTTRKLTTTLQKTIQGDSRHNTVLLPQGFPDYVLEVGDGHPGPNAGAIQRLRFYGAPGNLGCLHMNRLSHMWVLTELLFSGGPCPALVVENCWDSNYTNIDVLAHFTPGVSDPARHSSVIFSGGCGNIYCRGLRIEGALSGGLYVEDGPIYVSGGKIDDGFGGPQTAAAVTVARSGYLVLEDFYLGGMREQFTIDTAGALRLGRVILDGGTNKVAAINDRRAWQHRDSESVPGSTAASSGPRLPLLDLGAAEFLRFHPSVPTDTPAAVFSRIHPIRQAQHLTVHANDKRHGDSITIATDLRPSRDHQYASSFLVHNSTGTQVGELPGGRRRIRDSFADGSLLLHGSMPVTLDSDWSIEYCAGHYTPLQYRSCQIDSRQELFAVVCAAATIASAPSYVAAPDDPAYGTTRLKLTGPGLVPGTDLTGLFLVDNETGEPHYLQYGMDAGGFIGVMYDRVQELAQARTVSVVAGYAADVESRGGIASWTFAGAEHRIRLSVLRAMGFGIEELPLWAFPAGV